MFFIDFSPVKTDKKSDLDYDILELQKYDILAVTRHVTFSSLDRSNDQSTYGNLHPWS
jgi:hypothetical protein